MLPVYNRKDTGNGKHMYRTNETTKSLPPDQLFLDSAFDNWAAFDNLVFSSSNIGHTNTNKSRERSHLFSTRQIVSFLFIECYKYKVLPQTPGLSLPLQQAQNISLSDRSLNITNNGTSSTGTSIGIHKFDTDLGNVTGVSGTS